MMFVFKNLTGKELAKKIAAWTELAGETPAIRVVEGSWTDNGDPCSVYGHGPARHATFSRGKLTIDLGSGDSSTVRPEEIDGLMIALVKP